MDTTVLFKMFGTFILGLLGALAFVYIAKQQVLPEFRPFVDTQEKQKELDARKIALETTDADIKRLTLALVDATDGVKQVGIKGALEVEQKTRADIAQEILNQQRDLDGTQRQMRILGMVCYLLLGGVFAAIGSDFLKVEGLNESLSQLLKPMVIGATWTSFLTAMGFNFGKVGAEKQLDGIKTDVAASIETLKKDVSTITSKAVAAAEAAPQTAQPVMAKKTSEEVEKTITDASAKITRKLDLAQARVYSSFH